MSSNCKAWLIKSLLMFYTYLSSFKYNEYFRKYTLGSQAIPSGANLFISSVFVGERRAVAFSISSAWSQHICRQDSGANCTSSVFLFAHQHTFFEVGFLLRSLFYAERPNEIRSKLYIDTFHKCLSNPLNYFFTLSPCIFNVLHFPLNFPATNFQLTAFPLWYLA